MVTLRYLEIPNNGIEERSDAVDISDGWSAIELNRVAHLSLPGLPGEAGQGQALPLRRRSQAVLRETIVRASRGSVRNREQWPSYP